MPMRDARMWIDNKPPDCFQIDDLRRLAWPRIQSRSVLQGQMLQIVTAWMQRVGEWMCLN